MAAVTERLAIDVARPLLAWFDRHGRKHLPWQQNITPYRVWVSEIMLQQTQVATVIPYYERFMAALPTVAALAAADEDSVLHLWTGLGYYSRARNLQKAARLVCERFGGQLPTDVETLCELPGIGRSTAGAIAAIACGQHAPILDGNVKRVLARLHAIPDYPGETAVQRQLWAYATAHTPAHRTADYTQAIMDLGATLCTRSKPACASCPLAAECVAHKEDNPQAYPGRKPKRALPVRATRMLLIANDEALLLRRRPSSAGVWAGLWSFPEIAADGDAVSACKDELGLTVVPKERWQPLRHTFSHFHLDIEPVLLQVTGSTPQVMEADDLLWYNPQQPAAVGLAAPVKKLLERIADLQRIAA